MQLCEFCTQFEDCKLDKRRDQALEAPCGEFKRAAAEAEWLLMRLDRLGSPVPDGIRAEVETRAKAEYERTKKIIALAQERSRARAVTDLEESRPLYKINILTDLSERDLLGGDIPRNLHLEFLDVDLNSDEEKLKFVERIQRTVFSPIDDWHLFYDLCLEKGWFENEGGSVEDFVSGLFPIEVLQAVQVDLRVMVGRWHADKHAFGRETTSENPGQGDTPQVVMTDFDRLNAWIRHTLQLGIWRREDVAGVSNAEFDKTVRLYARIVPKAWYGVFFFLFAMDVVENQEMRQCPVCRCFFKPKPRRRGPRAPHCGRRSCTVLFSKHRGRYVAPD